VGLVAGFFASHLALGHGLGIVGDVLVGIVGAFLGGFLSAALHWSIVIVGHPIISAMIMAFLGAVILLLIVRLLGMGRGGARRRAYWG
ncbi:MAG TPA: GlsB/YeaQ/YmgE family stress response membrane protein, partial [Gemmatimonadales bacterium]|nr:GlsB/YeaQ/YmgE family stress response membrane protein [Gemmatimonadales bacterium]